MPLSIIAGVPLFVAVLFAGALHFLWRRRAQVPYAGAWGAAFACVAAGWAANIFTSGWAGAPILPGAASQLCWLGAALLFVQGLRRRAGRRDRSTVFQAIWAAIALAEALLAELTPFEPAIVQGCAPLLTAIGTILAGVAIRSPFRRAQFIDWLAAIVLFAAAVGAVLLDPPAAPGDPGLMTNIAMPLGAALAYVALGGVALVLLGEDLAIALERLARTDPLTGLWNRRAFDEAAPYLLARASRRATPSSAVVITDIDAFKSINDRFGHRTGDEVLTSFARHLKGALRPGDLLARLGGEEFVILAIGADGATLLARVEHIRQTIGRSGSSDGGLPGITASFGVAEYRAERGLRDALERADRALYRAKETGRDRSVLDESPIAPCSAREQD